MKQPFLPFIQGLRGLAVLAVLCFHAFSGLLPGGFIGVDVFFVISGYLITGIILRGLDAGDFSFARFYVRRIKRIFPALCLVLLACLSIAYLGLVPAEFDQLGKHTMGGAGFVSNFMLWREAGYFDNSAASKPLLHLWSLGIEEQFYIAAPLVLVLAWQRRSLLVPVLAMLVLASFGYSLWQIQSNPLAAFYSPLSRCWEIAAGGLLAYRHFTRVDPAPSTSASLRDLLSYAGAAALLLGAVFISNALRYPGVWALIPVLGTLLILEAGPKAALNRSIWAMPAMQWLGAISYPLYLWHWPLFSFAYIFQAGQPSFSTRMLAAAASVLLAHLTYKMIEKPVHRAARPAWTAAALAGLMIVVAGAGYAVQAHGGYPQRQIANLGAYLPKDDAPNPVAAAYHPVQFSADTDKTRLAMDKLRAGLATDVQFFGKSFDRTQALQQYGTCYMTDAGGKITSFAHYLSTSSGCTDLAAGKKNILVLGDSTAAEIRLTLARAYPEHNFVQITGSACKPFLAAYATEPDHRCRELFNHAIQVVQQGAFDAIVVASNWRDDFALALPDLQAMYGNRRQVLLVGPPLSFNVELAKEFARMEQGASLAGTVGQMLDSSNIAYSAAMQTFARDNGFMYMDRMQIYCEGGCPLISPTGEPMILDKFHLSLAGIDELSKRIKSRKLIEALLAAPA